MITSLSRRVARLALLVVVAGCRDDEPLSPTTAPTSEPAAAMAPAAFSARLLTAGWLHVCGVTPEDRAYCWGYNAGGQLGNGTASHAPVSRPVAVLGRHRFRQVSAGIEHSCGVTTDDRAYCWGSNFAGQLGDGTKTTRLKPVAVAGGLRFRQVDAGGYHTCGVTTGNRGYCWGTGRVLGDGTTRERKAPVAVRGGLRFRQVSAGVEHTCGLTTDSLAYCWGGNMSGQLGDGSTATRLKPVPVAGGRRFRQLSAGTVHTCGVAAGHQAYCWGFNGAGRLGDGTEGNSRPTPVAVAGGLSFERVTAGNWHTCGETTANQVYCWGDNSDGQLGDGTQYTERLLPTPVPGGFSFTQVSAGGWHSCARASTGQAYCWGSNIYGALGDGTTTLRLTPAGVAAPR